MKPIILSFLLIMSLLSCSDDIQYDERNPKYLITVDFAAGIVKDGGAILKPADKETIETCLKIKYSLPLPAGYSSKTFCMGSDGRETNFIYLELTEPTETKYLLMTYNESNTLVHEITQYHQTDCLNRWIINSSDNQ